MKTEKELVTGKIIPEYKAFITLFSLHLSNHS